MKTFAVVTPTYNRARFLLRLYESIKKQTFSYNEFAWIVVDDGSTDDTRTVMDSLAKSSPFEMIYLYKPNGGKHTAWKFAVDYLKDSDFEYFISIDSDDELTPDALEVFYQNWKHIEYHKSDVGLINARTLVIGQEDKANKIFDGKDYIEDTYHNVAIKNGEQSEMITSLRVRELDKYLCIPDEFWLSDKVKFFSENILWGRAGRLTKTRYLKSVLRIVHLDADNQVSHNKSRRGVSHLYNYIVGIKYYYSENLDYAGRYQRKQLIVDIIKYNAMCQLTDVGFREAYKQLELPILKLLYLVTFPVSLLAVLYFHMKNNVKSCPNTK